MSDKTSKLRIPCLRGKIGDWYYYSGILSFEQVSLRVKLPSEINKKYNDPNLKLGEWIQRDINDKRIDPIKRYLLKKDQRFFNSLILGIYDGEPSWQELNVSINTTYGETDMTERELEYFSSTFGILTLSGEESIFAIDGQHRMMGVRKAFEENSEKFNKDEISILLVAHKTSVKGKERTRRLFSTVNRYAKPVNKSEIIALSEDDNCAILTRRLVDKYSKFKDKIIINKNRPISVKDNSSFTSVIMLYDIVTCILTNKKIQGYPNELKGYDEKYTIDREKDGQLNRDYQILTKIFNRIISNIPELKLFFTTNVEIQRERKESSLLFRVIGQNVFFDLVKIGINEGKLTKVLNYFSNESFNLANKTWRKVFWDEGTNKLVTEKARQKYCKLLIMEKLDFPIKRTPKDKEVANNFRIKISEV